MLGNEPIAANWETAASAAGDFSEKTAGESWAILSSDTWRYDHTARSFFRWCGTHWQRDSLKSAFHELAQHCFRMSHGKKMSGKAGFVKGAAEFAAAHPKLAVDHSVWNTNHFLLGTPGRTVNLQTGELITPNPQHLITKRTAVEPQPGTALLWERFLNEATGGDRSLVRFLQQLAGYCLTGSTNEQVLFFIHGSGKNGKSVFANTMRRILGDYAVAAPMDTFTVSRGDRHPTDLAMLQDGRLVLASETEEGRQWAEAKIKQLTGGDAVTARFMRQDFFTYDPQFKLVIVGNHRPQLQNVDEATRRRFIIIEFKHTPSCPDPHLEEKLTSEHGQILQWAIDGCLDWQRNGLMRPECVVKATDDYFDTQDLFGQWINEACELGESFWEQPTPLYRSWSEFARSNGEDPGSTRSFYDKLPKRGFIARKTGGIRSYRGLKLRVQCNAHVW